MKFASFLTSFIPELSRKSRQLNQAYWILETTGSPDAANLKADLDAEVRLMFHNPATYQKLLAWQKENHDPLHARQLDILVRAFRQNQIPAPLVEEIARKEATLAQTYANFRATFRGKQLSENELREILKSENDVATRKKAWEASKQIGSLLAPQILKLVELRNESARKIGYPDYFQMQLELQEVDGKWLFSLLEDFAAQSEKAYSAVVGEINASLSSRFAVPVEELGPWAWSEPFCQEDPLDAKALDNLVKGIDITETSRLFYEKMGLNVQPILDRSDMHEREGKNQHAFCMHVDREGDVRTLNNVQSSLKWLETVLHELGHAVYELGFDPKLPWLLKEPPHMITTEAIALIAGRQAYRTEALTHLVGAARKELREKAQVSLRRRQLIFSRWVLVMTFFEAELYRDPTQNLNALWWSLIEKYQKISPPPRKSDQRDWAAKYHIGLAPVYYFSYLLGEMFASSIQESLQTHCGSPSLTSEKAGQFLQEKIFHPGNRMPWSQLVQYATGRPLAPDAWIREFG